MRQIGYNGVQIAIVGKQKELDSIVNSNTNTKTFLILPNEIIL